MHALVMAKEPRPGLVKTRLSPEYSPEAAAAIALAALRDTLAAVQACRATRRVVALDGNAGDWLPTDFDVIDQRGDGLGERLTAAWIDCGAPGLQIGMDTPQVTAALLDDAMDRLTAPSTDAVLGRADDGGWWAIGFRDATPHAFDGVPMSADDTGERQLWQLRRLGLRVGLLPQLRDLDRPEDLHEIARTHPHLRVAALA